MSLFDFFKKSPNLPINPYIVEPRAGVARSYFTYFCARLDFKEHSLSPLLEIWSGVPSSVCNIGTGSSDLFVHYKLIETPQDLAEKLYFHEEEIKRNRGENIIFKNQVPPFHSDIVSPHYMRTPLPESSVLEVARAMKRLSDENRKFLTIPSQRRSYC